MRIRGRSQPAAVIPTASMADVVFLLIIFFRPQGFFGRMVERT